jgi:hypothetical protein
MAQVWSSAFSAVPAQCGLLPLSAKKRTFGLLPVKLLFRAHIGHYIFLIPFPKPDIIERQQPTLRRHLTI